MSSRQMVALFLIAATVLLCFGLPKPAYKSPNILPTLQVPAEFGQWQSRDVSQEINRQATYSFISNVFARVYRDAKGRGLLFMVLDAGNFHNPKVCYGSMGYISNDLPDTAFNLPYKTMNATSVSLSKDKTNLVIIYWLCINQKLVSWTGQKVQELFYSLTNRQKTGLMVRIDVPIAVNSSTAKAQAAAFAQGFISDLSRQLPAEDLHYIFGK